MSQNYRIWLYNIGLAERIHRPIPDAHETISEQFVDEKCWFLNENAVFAPWHQSWQDVDL